MANTPRIRFKGFTDDWEQRKLGEIVEFLDTMRKPLEEAKRVPGPYPYYGASGIVDYVEDYIFDEELVLLSEDGANITDRNYPVCFLASGKYWVNNHAHVLRTKNGHENNFICNSLERKDYNQYNSGMAMPKLNKEECRSIPVSCPSCEEQKRIGDYFRNLDHLITLHQRECDETKKLKKFMLQKMFPKNGEKNPEIRFAGFTDDWEQRKLGEICERLTRKNKDNESDLPLTISSQHGLIDQRDFFNKVVAAKDMSEYYLLQKGEFAYNKSYSNGYDYGSIKRLNSYEKGCLSTLYICFKLISDKVNSDYLECYFDTLAWYYDVSQICSEGARNHGLLNVDVKAFFTEVTVKLPVDVKEQQQISAILHSLDHLITLHQRKCDKLKLIKKFMLQNMFPQKG